MTRAGAKFRTLKVGGFFRRNIPVNMLRWGNKPFRYILVVALLVLVLVGALFRRQPRPYMRSFLSYHVTTTTKMMMTMHRRDTSSHILFYL